MQHILEIMHNLFKSRGYEIRAVGGCVRDFQLGMIPSDIDFATTATPDQMMAMDGFDGWRVLPTGLDHGTVTFMSPHGSFEVTTLRTDKETDGRHAVVEFTADWELDASRRDLTINAMYMDHELGLIDYFDGLTDLQNGVVRFVGNAEDRIKEDYLRMIRFMRFHARFGANKPSADAAAAIWNNKEGIKNVSAERVWKEILAAAKYPNSFGKFMEEVFCFDMLNRDNFTTRFMGPAIPSQNFWKRHEDNVARCPQGVLAQSMIYMFPGESRVISAFADAFKLSTKEKKDMIAVLEIHKYLTGAMPRRFINEMRVKGFTPEQISVVCDEWGILPDNMRAWDFMQVFSEVPVFPVNGTELQEVTSARGKDLGELINKLKSFWITSDFTLSKEEILDMVKKLN